MELGHIEAARVSLSQAKKIFVGLGAIRLEADADAALGELDAAGLPRLVPDFLYQLLGLTTFLLVGACLNSSIADSASSSLSNSTDNSCSWSPSCIRIRYFPLLSTCTFDQLLGNVLPFCSCVLGAIGRYLLISQRSCRRWVIDLVALLPILDGCMSCLGVVEAPRQPMLRWVPFVPYQTDPYLRFLSP